MGFIDFGDLVWVCRRYFWVVVGVVAECCLDESDEDRCGECEEFRCNSGACVKNKWVCDGENDCDGGEDEMVSYIIVHG